MFINQTSKALSIRSTWHVVQMREVEKSMPIIKRHQKHRLEKTQIDNKVNKKGVTVIWHSMVKFVKFENFSEENYVANIQRNLDCTTKDVADYIKTIIRRKPDILVYTGTNNLTNSVNAMNKVRKIVKTVE